MSRVGPHRMGPHVGARHCVPASLPGPALHCLDNGYAWIYDGHLKWSTVRNSQYQADLVD